MASRASAMMPAASGAEAEVPVCESVHFCRRSVVTWRERAERERERPRHSLSWGGNRKYSTTSFLRCDTLGVGAGFGEDKHASRG